MPDALSDEQVNSSVDIEPTETQAKIEVCGEAKPSEKGGDLLKTVTGPGGIFFPWGSDKEIFEDLVKYWEEGVGKKMKERRVEEEWCWGWVSERGVSVEVWRGCLRRSADLRYVWSLLEERCKNYLVIGSLLGWINSKVATRLLEAFYEMPRESSNDSNSRATIIVRGVRGIKEDTEVEVSVGSERRS
jgi:hypothetical protein